MIYKTWINEPFGMINKDYLIQIRIEEDNIRVHLVELEL